jgi:hypothetical protein
MNDPSSLSARLSRSLASPSHGVTGFVDELLGASREQDIRLSWRAGHCQISIPRIDPPENVEVPVQKSVIRAVLARVATLCNDCIPNSVSPYRGVGAVAIDSTNSIRVEFVNTPDEQSLELSHARTGSP